MKKYRITDWDGKVEELYDDILNEHIDWRIINIDLRETEEEINSFNLTEWEQIFTETGKRTNANELNFNLFDENDELIYNYTIDL